MWYERVEKKQEKEKKKNAATKHAVHQPHIYTYTYIEAHDRETKGDSRLGSGE